METIWEYICSICTQKDTQNNAVVWCPECEEALCEGCHEHHSISKVSKNHKTIPVEEYEDLPKYISSIEHYCDRHDEKFEFLCPFHDEPCCVNCISETHKQCRDFKPINDVLKDVKDSSSLEDLETDITKTGSEFAKVINRKLNNIKIIQNQAKCHNDKVCQLRKTINDHLDTLEKKFKTECIQFEHNYISETEALLTQVKSNQSKTNKLFSDFSKMKRSATNFQTYIGMKKIGGFLKETELYFESLEREGHLREHGLRIKLNPALENFVQNFKYLAELESFDAETETLQLQTLNIGQAQNLLNKNFNVMVGKIVKVNLSSKNEMDITGCEILEDGKLVFVDMRQKQIVFHQQNGAFGGQVGVAEEPYDITFLKDGLAAVSLLDSKKILLIDITEKSTSFITVKGKCWGLDFISCDKMLLRFPNKNCSCILDLKGNELSVVNTPGEFILYNCWFSDKIYCTDWEQNKVFCHSHNGQLLWSYENEVLREPLGIATDSRGFVYVAGSSSNNVVVITPDGQHGEELLVKKDGLSRPQAIYYSKASNKLLVCNRSNGTALLCHIWTRPIPIGL